MSRYTFVLALVDFRNSGVQMARGEIQRLSADVAAALIRVGCVRKTTNRKQP